MTTDERFERIVHHTAALAEERRRDREEYKTLWRDLAQKHENIARQLEALAIDTRLRFEQVADRFQETNDSIAQLAAESREADKRLEQRIESLVSAIGQFLTGQKQP
jgi:hypothetical protein